MVLRCEAMQLRGVTSADFPGLVEMMRDPESRALAAFGSRDDDAKAMEARWAQAAGEGTCQKVILVAGGLAGFVATFRTREETHVTYWVKRELWGRGIASSSLEQLLREVKTRPLHASVWEGNPGSVRVLETQGFRKTHTEVAFAAARGADVVEVFFTLE
jgi:RimJ/RimL family protein N-acetyltransferase